MAIDRRLGRSRVAVSRRVGKLESASSRIAAGRFDQPIGDENPDELGRLARSFDLMQDRLAQVDRARKDFIANASHELRTPLFSLGGFLELLAEEDLDAGHARGVRADDARAGDRG